MIPEWQMKLPHEMNDHERELYEAWDPSQEEALAVTKAVAARMYAKYPDLQIEMIEVPVAAKNV